MFGAMLVIILLPVTDLGRSKGLLFKPFSEIVCFFLNLLVLISLGAKQVESP